VAGVIDAGYNQSRITDHFSQSVTVTALAPEWGVAVASARIAAWASALA
jgi:hypothetical protein